MTRDEEDLEIIKDPTQWPMVYVLPVKNYKSRDKAGFPALGIILRANPLQVVVESIDHVVGMGEEAFKQVPRKNYESVEAMVADGWIVD